MWDSRYAKAGFAYGTEPNEFVRDNKDFIADHVPERGRALCLGAGEGRNAVWLAQTGLSVTAVDGSAVGLDKAQALARERGVADRLETVVSDLAEFDLGEARWELVLSIFCHVPPALRCKLHRALPAALAPGGLLLLEAYTPRQLDHGTGGPPALELLFEPEQLRDELEGLEILRCEELEREVHEGDYHNGASAVVQLIARRPR